MSADDKAALIARLEELADGWESEADDNEDQHRQGAAIARAVRACARDLRDVLAPPPPPVGPHSRACGITPHAHGSACHSNCPTCGGRP